MSKQDRQGARTAADIERKYNFGRTFAEVYGLISDAQKAIEEVNKEFETLDSEGIFNRLTNYGEIQGIYRENDQIYINATYIKSGKLAADYIDADNLKVNAANITGTLEANQISLTGAITWGDLDSGVQAVINEAGGISVSQAQTIINSTLVSSPTIAGGSFNDLAQTTWLEMGTPTSSVAYLMQYSVLYSQFDPVCVMGFSGTTVNPNWVLAPFFNIALNYLETNKTMYAIGNWNFSQANVSGLDVGGGDVIPVWG